MRGETLVLPHLEIGDQIVQNGICRYLAKRGRRLAWCARHDNVDIIRKMYADLPNVRVVEIHEYNYDTTKALIGNRWDDEIRIGFFSKDGFNIGVQTDAWDSIYYENAGISFDERWNSFALPPRMLPPPADIVPETWPFGLLHERLERNCGINRARLPQDVPMVSIHPAFCFWDWLIPVVSASELHFIDSCFLNLAESLYTLGYLRNTRIVFHEYSKLKALDARPPQLRAPWERLT